MDLMSDQLASGQRPIKFALNPNIASFSNRVLDAYLNLHWFQIRPACSWPPGTRTTVRFVRTAIAHPMSTPSPQPNWTQRGTLVRGALVGGFRLLGELEARCLNFGVVNLAMCDGASLCLSSKFSTCPRIAGASPMRNPAT